MKDRTLILLTLLLGIGHGVAGSGGKRGDPCKRDTDCDQQSLIGCDRNSGKCACPTHFPLYYSSEGKCVSYVHGICTYVKSSNLPSIDCIDNAICVKPRDPLEVNGKCECKKGYERTGGNACASIPKSISGGGIEKTSKGGAPSSTKLPSTHKYPEGFRSSDSSGLGPSFSLGILIIILLPFHLRVH